jgi:hypothetical protein
MQKMPADRVVVGFDLDAPPVMAVVIPIEQHRAERREQPVGDVPRTRQVVVIFSGSALPSTEQPVRITSIGCAAEGKHSSAF